MSLKTNPVSSGYSTGVINSNFKKIEKYVNDNLLNRDGVTPGEPNQMEVDLDMNSQDILNVGRISARTLEVNGTDLQSKIDEAERFAEEAREALELTREVSDKFGDVDSIVEEVTLAKDSAEDSAVRSESSAEESSAQVVLAEQEADRAESGADRAEAASNAAFINADVYPDVATGRAAVADGEQFQVVEGDEVVRYRRDGSTTQTEMARYPASEKVDRLANDLPPMVRQARDVSRGLAVTKPGEQFIVSSHNETVLYETYGNLFDPSAVIEGRYIASNGASSAASGAGHSDYIRVRPGTVLSFAANTERRSGVAFYTENKEWTGDFNNSSIILLTLEVPANAAYMRFNVKSPTVPQPTELMVNEGEPLPYVPFGVKEAIVVTETPSKAALSQVLDFYTSDNLFVPEDVEKNLLVSSGTPTYVQRIVGWGMFVVPASEGDVFTVYSPSGAVRRGGAAFFDVLSPKSGDLAITGSYNNSGASITVTAPAGAQSFVINTHSLAEPLPDDLMIVRGSTQIPYMPGGELLFVKRSSIRPEISNDGGEAKNLTFVFNGGEGSISSITSKSGLSRNFVAVPVQDPLSLPARFNMRADKIEGVTLRDSADDIAPDHIDDTTVGANHGYTLGVVAASGHEKTVADCGSVWASGGVEAVLADVLDADQLLLARVDARSAPPSGTYSHVSGAANTGSLEVTAVTSRQWYPPHKNWALTTLADGQKIEPGEHSAESVQFIERADILARADIINAWIANGGIPGGYEPNAPASIAQTLTYEYDKRGQLTIARDWLTVKDIEVRDLMGVQFARVGTEQEYIIPGSLPFEYQGETIDYSMGVAADHTLASGVSVWMRAGNLQAEGEYAHRVLVLYPNAVFAIGLLPVGDAAYEVRRARTSANAMEIRGNTGKLYFRVLDIGNHTSVAGDQYSAIGYRHILPRSTVRTAFYAVEGGGATWVYADWHNKDGLDRLPIDEQHPELIGRTFEVVEARNVTVSAGVIAGSLPVIVSADGSSASLILKVA